uniref:Uncharacterized protein n=1 Tax=Emiliania huxleyi (strain CCMP1516) TaxID=280463 RepID=A0A0D3J7M3_EMIH1
MGGERGRGPDFSRRPRGRALRGARPRRRPGGRPLPRALLVPARLRARGRDAQGVGPAGDRGRAAPAAAAAARRLPRAPLSGRQARAPLRRWLVAGRAHLASASPAGCRRVERAAAAAAPQARLGRRVRDRPGALRGADDERAAGAAPAGVGLGGARRRRERRLDLRDAGRRLRQARQGWPAAPARLPADQARHWRFARRRRQPRQRAGRGCARRTRGEGGAARRRERRARFSLRCDGEGGG